MDFSIDNATPDDLPVIYHLFEEAILFQKQNNYKGWNSYDREFIKSDIQNGLLYKIVSGDDIACIFSICFSDVLIWREKEKGNAVYLHRIVLNRKFAGGKIFQKVLEWAMQFAREAKLKYIRMDTWADNEKIIAYYKSYGFVFVENYTTPDTENLPVQHRNLNVALLELNVQHTIYIVGAGAIGKALAVFLKLEGKDVVIIRGSVDDKPGYIEKISVELPNNATVEAEVEVSTANNFPVLNGLIVLTNKSFGNQHLAGSLRTKINNSPVLILQNGLNVEQPFIDSGYFNIYRCVLFATCQSLFPNVLRFKPVAVSPIGAVKGDSGNLEAIAGQVNNRYFQFRAEENIQPVVWTKTIVNSVFNSVCPLLETDNGIFHRNQSALNIAKKIIDECVTIANGKGICLDADEVMKVLLRISKSSDGQLISTYQDIKNKRRTEIETLNFAIADIANGLKQADAVKETRLLGELIKLKSELVMNPAV